MAVTVSFRRPYARSILLHLSSVYGIKCLGEILSHAKIMELPHSVDVLLFFI